MKIVPIVFHNDIILAADVNGEILVAVKPISDRLGLSWNKQLERIKRDPILREGMTVMVIPGVGGGQETTCLKLHLVNGWLFGIEEGRIKDPLVREAVLVYKRECFRVLFEHFYGKAKERVEQGRPASDATPPEAAEPRQFPNWSGEEWRLKLSTADSYDRRFGKLAAQWVMTEHLGFPVPPREMIDVGRQLGLFDHIPPVTITVGGGHHDP